nr:acetate/propionate family kinase [Stackebrandtia nassauensis]
MRVLVVNAGSSSLKLRLLGHDDELVSSVDVAESDRGADRGAIEEFLDGCGGVDAVGHRVVHGGPDFGEAVRLSASVRERLAAISDLAPLHQPRALSGIDTMAALLPRVAAVACFDTTFHATLPPAAAEYALPRRWRDRWRLRRYGFHGLSHGYAARRAAELLGRLVGESRIVTCHLGAGASLAAVDGGRSVDTTMGFTPLEGVVMATRSGSVDPGLLLWLMDHEGLSIAETNRVLEHESGLAGLSDVSGDIRRVYAEADSGDVNARLALEVYVHRLRAGIASMAAAMNGLDVLVFTGGVGENQPRLRAAAMAGLGFVGVVVDEDRNAAAEADRVISASGSRVAALVVAAREDLEIARQTRSVLERESR